MAQTSPTLLRPERARTPGRATWVTVLGLVLVPLVVGGLLTWALWKPTERLDRMQAAIVNLDQAVEVDGQTVPLGRQLTSALVTAGGASDDAAAAAGDTAGDEAGSGGGTDATGVANVSGSDSSGNFTWVLTDADDAEEGLADGTYATVVTIPEDFSVAATSFGGEAGEAVQARIDIATSERSRLVDAAVAQAVTTTAVGLLNDQLTTTYLDNVLVGFTTLHDSLGEAASGADQLASGAGQLGTGATQVADGTTALADGVGQLGAGADQLAGGIGTLGTGAGQLAGGVGQLATGAGELSSGLSRLAQETRASAQAAAASAPQVAQLTAGADALAAGIAGDGGLGQNVSGLASGIGDVQTGASQLFATLADLAADCAAAVPQACETLVAITSAESDGAPTGPSGAPTLTSSIGRLALGADRLDDAVSRGIDGAPALTTSTTQLATGVRGLADGVTASASGLGALADYLDQSAQGAAQLASGARTAAGGARDLATGARTAAGGARELASGADDAASGAGELASGAGQVASGATELSSGAGELASGLGQAGEQVPSYTDEEASTLADVVATPVAARSDDGALFGDTSVPWLAALALWLGGLATFVVLAAVPRRALGSTRSSVRLALGAFAPGALVGAVQGLAVGGIMAFALDLSPSGWAAFFAVAVLAGVAFAAVNQGLVAVLGGVGRFVSVVIAVVGLAGAVVSTVPALVEHLFRALPLSAALDGLQGVVTGQGGAGGAIAALLVWTLVGLGASAAAVARRRVVPAGQLARWVRTA
ncbi:YhgE/Pip domain-containing protein [Cellulomonas sp. NS3]|uniref:YhgE/Pip domain-containing protein n=1 Tax=Cellulomonas sp. NS3 TaxID=2973977 RepID=UPI002161531D|nr:YhgE/Pip domain-containing protein [Cellulomonas sp. NS3]